MFKRHSKAGRGKQIVAQQVAEVRRKRERLDDQMRRLQAIKDWDTWLAISDKLDKEQRQARSPESVREEPVLRQYRSVAIDGREVLIGRNGRENDEVTFHLAQPDDFWLHVADYSGSHVVVRNPARAKELDVVVLAKAAQLAAFFSQARNSSKVESALHPPKARRQTEARQTWDGARTGIQVDQRRTEELAGVTGKSYNFKRLCHFQNVFLFCSSSASSSRVRLR